MALPTQRHTTSRKKVRAKNFRLKKVNYSTCAKCKRPVLPHHACKFCGVYNHRDTLKIKIRKAKAKQ